MDGVKEKIESFIRLARSQGHKELVRYWSAELLKVSPDDTESLPNSLRMPNAQRRMIL